jgi:hypothetical protein
VTLPLPAQDTRFSTRLLRKGALIEETYRAFQSWDLSASVRQNLQRLRETNLIGADNQAWLGEVAKTLSSRFHSEAEVRPLVTLARKGLPLQEWKAFLLWHIGQTDALYYRFATEWLFDQYVKGIHNLRTEDAVPFFKATIRTLTDSQREISEYGVLRGARDLLRMAGDFGLLNGKAVKNFAPFQMPEHAFLYVAHALTEKEANARKMMERPEWRLFLLTPQQVEREVLELHQFRKLEYHMAGSLAQLDLPAPTAAAYAESLTL